MVCRSEVLGDLCSHQGGELHVEFGCLSDPSRSSYRTSPTSLKSWTRKLETRWAVSKFHSRHSKRILRCCKLTD